jgi:hypothetical protein
MPSRDQSGEHAVSVQPQSMVIAEAWRVAE